jgi:hypothetical protein
MRACGLLAAFVSLGVAGCVTLEQVSAGHVGCRPEEIKVSNDELHFASRIWNATCHDRVYLCSAAGHDVACTETR